MYWITDRGIDYLTEEFDNSPIDYSPEWIRRTELLGMIEREGGGLSVDQILDLLWRRPVPNPVHGSRQQYYDTLSKLVREGKVLDLRR